ncbi:outer membrane protein [Consotaella salsifontis]|uniref:Outer membrane immunogenic protein n=1 Tax=Consotaella salsifontis TaxID=1365950 RepID=A0A1T4RKP8_9HYPH|nr:outer membrane beta-barrel protein [Consotaella salsifontis]SKA16356.1 outer membrane immunogenic protein [Consotaella salsifontis]
MKRIALLLASTVIVTPALAADLVYDEPPAPAPVVVAPTYSWTGFYVGGQAGAAFGGDVYDSGDDDAGFIGGVHVGYDYQVDNFVFGALLDLSYMDADTSRTYDVTNNAGTTIGSVTAGQEINFLGTARLKAGVAWDRALIYGTGGLAYANVDDSAASALEDAGYDVHSDSDDFGYTVGGGVEFLATPNLSLGVEYLYTNLGDHDFDVDGGAGDVDFKSSSDLDFHTVWAKVSYRFN